jgi:hypothetical protein
MDVRGTVPAEAAGLLGRKLDGSRRDPCLAGERRRKSRAAFEFQMPDTFPEFR